MTATMGGIYFDPVVIRTNYTAAMGATTVTVLEAPDVAAISTDLYERACAGECEHLEAGEGLVVIYADNGTFRYRLTGDFESVSYAHIMQKIAGPTLVAERAS